ncbi:hypothetical protein [Tahibacter soli]|uniref:Transmembrane protein n=1 Tax=Tahibacter soli TaxID=2983605 RepID=A0A9X3YP81_9GAMM|nr:hypothetical protein [Tahibacter soli]MDC8015864.1 hypothetical protein [Tahibacter soli]
MNADVSISLAFILFFPWFAILGGLFAFFPRTPRGPARRVFDVATLAAAAALSIWAMRWGYLNADANAGNMWKQILATLTAYGMFLAVLAIALPLRRLLLKKA